MTNRPTNYNENESLTPNVDIEEETIILEEVHRKKSNNEIHVDRNGKQHKINKKHAILLTRIRKHKIFHILNKIGIVLLVFLLLVVLGGGGYFLVSRELGKNSLIQANKDAVIKVSEDAESEDDSGHTITYKGQKYRYNENLASIVFMGVDESELTNETGVAGTADAVYIFTFDTETSKCSIITVNRDTMVDVHLRSATGKEMGYEKMQLCLSYAYGDGKETSCENTLDSLSRIFYNIPFTNYVSLSWDSIAPLNDAIDGVTLKCLEDITTKNSTFSKGETITLMGQDAKSYVRYRDTTILKSNPMRLSRQKQYITAYMDKALPIIRDDLSFIGKLYTTVSDYMCTTLSQQEVTYIASKIVPTLYSTKDINFVEIDGEINAGEQYAEFTPNETSLYETILKVFYEKVE